MCSPTASIASAYGNADVLGLRRDLADDLDDVAVRVEHAQLRIGARAAAEDLLDPAELAFGAELARMRLHELERPADHLRDRHPVPAARVQIHHRRVEPVPGGQPLVLRREDAVERRDLLAGVEALA